MIRSLMQSRPFATKAQDKPRSGLGEVPQAWRILLLTCRKPETDFRLALARELHGLGHQVTYAYVKNRPVVTELGISSQPKVFSAKDFLFFLRRDIKKSRPLLVINSTNLAYPLLSRAIRQVCGGIWCFDMHDDLLYGRKGVSRAKAAIVQRVLLSGSDLVVHAAPTLQELFPDSRHLGNASSLTALDRDDDDFNRVLILASLDERFDFAFMATAAAANPRRSFHVHGQVALSDPAIQVRLDTLVRSHPNVFYHGAYVNDELPDILNRYAVSLAPYATASRLTRYIDPLRFYHCLNSGMEVISTDIPKAHDLVDTLHIVTSPAEIGPLLLRLQNDRPARKNTGSTADLHNWRNRAMSLMQLAEAALAQRSGGKSK